MASTADRSSVSGGIGATIAAQQYAGSFGICVDVAPDVGDLAMAVAVKRIQLARIADDDFE